MCWFLSLSFRSLWFPRFVTSVWGVTVRGFSGVSTISHLSRAELHLAISSYGNNGRKRIGRSIDLRTLDRCRLTSSCLLKLTEIKWNDFRLQVWVTLQCCRAASVFSSKISRPFLPFGPGFMNLAEKTKRAFIIWLLTFWCSVCVKDPQITGVFVTSLGLKLQFAKVISTVDTVDCRPLASAL